jgi:hypothetical protein
VKCGENSSLKVEATTIFKSKKVKSFSKVKRLTQVGVDSDNGETLFEAGNSAHHPLIARIGVQNNLNTDDEFKCRRFLQLFTYDESEATGRQ